MADEKHFKVKLVRSGAGRKKTQRLTLEGLGLTRMNRVRFLKDTPAIRGMLYKVNHLIEVTPQTGEMPLSARGKARLHQQGVTHAAT
jgi:large subunit ribosomal protein L30